MSDSQEGKREGLFPFLTRTNFARLSAERVDQSGQEASFAFHHRGVVTVLTPSQSRVEQVPQRVTEHVETVDDNRQEKPGQKVSQPSTNRRATRSALPLKMPEAPPIRPATITLSAVLTRLDIFFIFFNISTSLNKKNT